MKKIASTLLPLFLSLTLIYSFSGVNAQEKCGTDQAHQRLMDSDPSYKAAVETNEANILKAYQKGVHQEKAQYTFPVVFHVIHKGEPIGTGTNISDAQIQSAIEGLNRDFANSEPNQSWGNPNGVDTDIQFCLAQRDPNGNPSTGINRVDGRVVNNYTNQGIVDGAGGNELQVKALSNWDNQRYINVWVVSEINNQGSDNLPSYTGGTIGYAYFPGAAANRDGIVIIYCATGIDPDGSRGFNLWNGGNNSDAMTHEIGHYLSLYHTFEGGSCAAETNCNTQGDRVCDTPPTVQAGSCAAPACAGDMVDNWMHYTGAACTNRFSQGQKDRMLASIASTTRQNVGTSNGCQSVFQRDIEVVVITDPSIDFSCNPTVTPTFEVKNSGSDIVTSLEMEYVLDAGAPVSKTFALNLAPQQTASLSFDPFTASQAPHTLDINVVSINGNTDQRASNNKRGTTFDIITGANVTIEVEDYETQVDNEDYFEIREKDGTVLYHVDLNDGVGAFGSYSEEFCLEPTCYDFFLYDSRFIPSNYGDPATGAPGRAARFTIKDYKGDVIATGFNNAPTTLSFIEPYSETEEFCPPETVCELTGASAAGPTSAVCEGANINLTAATGTNYTYSWSGPDSFTSTNQNPTITGATLAKAGTYKVVVDSLGCSKELSVTVSVNAKPSIVLTSDPETCGPVDIKLAGALNFSWTRTNNLTGMSNTGTATTNITGTLLNTGATPVDETFTVTGVDNNSCQSDPKDVSITFNPTPDLTLTPNNNEVCTGESISVVASSSVAGATFAWTRSNASITGLPLSGSGDISSVTVTATNMETDNIAYSVSANGCTTSQNATLTVNPYPTLSHDVVAGPLCSEATFNLNVAVLPATATISWSRANAALTGMPTSGTDNVSGSLKNSSTSNASESFTLSAELNGCKTDSVLDPIVIQPQLDLTLSSNSPVTQGSTINLTASASSGSVSWTGPNGFSASGSTANKPVADFADAGYYVATLQDGNCSRIDSIEAVVNAANCDLDVTLAGTTTTCENNGQVIRSTVVGNTGAVTYSWTGPNGFTSTDDTILIPGALTDAGTYKLTVTEGFCSASDQISFVVNSGANVSIAGVFNICTGESTTLTASGADTFLWDDGSTNATRTVAPSTTTEYSVVGTKNGCSQEQKQTVTVFDLPTVTFSPITAATEGEDVTLTISSKEAQTTYTWTGPNNYSASGDVVTIMAIEEFESGYYVATATNDGGCSTVDSIEVDVNAQTCAVTITPSATSICEGDNFTLSATVANPDGFAYSWSGPNGFVSSANPATISAAAPASAGVYKVVATSAFCKDSTVQNITVNTASKVSLVINDPINGEVDSTGFCENQGAVTLRVNNLPTPGSTYTVNYKVLEQPGFTGSAIVSTSQRAFVYNPSGAGTHTIAITSITANPAAQCAIFGDTVTITIKPLPTISVAFSTNNICIGDSVRVDITTGGSASAVFSLRDDRNIDRDTIYKGTSTGVYPPFYVTPDLPGKAAYRITSLTDGSGQCANFSLPAPFEVIVANSPTVSLGADDRVCEGAPFNIAIQSNETVEVAYTINGGSQLLDTLSNGQFISGTLAPSTTPYQLQLLRASSLVGAQCTRNFASETANITVDESPDAILTFNPAVPCEGELVTAKIEVTKGVPAYQLSYVDINGNTVNTGSSNNSEVEFTFTAINNATVTLNSVTSSGNVGCVTAKNTPYTLTTRPIPSGTVSNDITLCYKQDSSISFQLNGTGPFSLEYTYQGKGKTLNNVNDGDNFKIVKPTQTDSLMLTRVSDVFCSSPTLNEKVIINVLDVPQVSLLKLNNDSCAPIVAKLDYTTSEPLNGCEWEIDGALFYGCYQQNIPITIDNVYDVGFRATTNNGCRVDLLEQSFVETYPSLQVDFAFANTEPLNFLNNSTQVDNLTAFGNTFAWYIQDSVFLSSEPSPELIFHVDTPTVYNVKLIATSNNICVDSVEKSISVSDYLELYIPNTFTPDGDGINDRFGPTFTHEHFISYRLSIFDKWGRIIFTTTDPYEQWDGTFERVDMPSTMYIFKLDYSSEFQAVNQSQSGVVNLLR